MLSCRNQFTRQTEEFCILPSINRMLHEQEFFMTFKQLIHDHLNINKNEIFQRAQNQSKSKRNGNEKNVFHC